MSNRWMTVSLIMTFLGILAARPLRSGVREVRYRSVPLNGQSERDLRPVGPSRSVERAGGRHLIPAAVGTVIDSTVFDYQGNGTLPRRVVAVGDSALHLIAFVSPEENMIDRGTRYVYYAHDLFDHLGYVFPQSGFGSLTGYFWPELGNGNVAVIATTVDISDSLPPWLSFQDILQGFGSFSTRTVDPGPVFDECDQVFYPSIYARNNAEADMAMCGLTISPCSGGFPDIMVTHTDSAVGWVEGQPLDTMDDSTLWNAGPDIPAIDGSDDGLVGIVSTDFGTNVYTWESTDGGKTWGDRVSITGYSPDPQKIAPDSSSTEYRPLQNAVIAVSPGGVPHVVWTAYQARGNPSDSIYTPGTDGLWQYRTKLEHWDPVHGVSTIYRHAAGLSDQAYGTAFAYNVGHPTIGFGETGEVIYVVYEGFIDSDRDMTNGYYFGDIYVSLSTDGGATWEKRVNVTASPGSDDLYPSIARINPQGALGELDGFAVGDFDGINDFVLLYQNDDVAGTFFRGDEPDPNFDRLLVAPVDFAEVGPAGIGGSIGEGDNKIPRAFALSQNHPNPFNPSTTIDYRVVKRSRVTIGIYDVRGRMVREIVDEVKEPGRYAVQWNGRDRSGGPVASGIYIYRMKTGGKIVAARKMTVLK